MEDKKFTILIKIAKKNVFSLATVSGSSMTVAPHNDQLWWVTHLYFRVATQGLKCWESMTPSYLESQLQVAMPYCPKYAQKPYLGLNLCVLPQCFKALALFYTNFLFSRPHSLQISITAAFDTPVV